MSEIMRGQLKRIRLPGLLQLVESEAITGWLGIGSVGGVALSEGEAVQASCNRWTGYDALMELFLEEEGVFRVESWDSAPGKPLGNMLPLVMEGCRLMDEWERLASARPRLVRPDSAPEGVPALLLTGQSTTAQIAARQTMRRTALIDLLLPAIDSGAVVLDAQTAPTAARAARQIQVDYYNAMDLGRSRMLAHDYAGAAAYFQRALAARPNDRLAKIQLNRAQNKSTQEVS